MPTKSRTEEFEASEYKGEPHYYCARSIVEWPHPPKFGPHIDVQWTSAAVTASAGHERMKLWNRGAFAGELFLIRGDSVALAAALDLVRVASQVTR